MSGHQSCMNHCSVCVDRHIHLNAVSKTTNDQRPTNNEQRTTNNNSSSNNNNNNRRLSQVCPLFLCVTCEMDPSWQPVTGAAQRRRGRQLRAAWRHEQQSIPQALAAYTHHSAPRRQTIPRAGGWERVALHGQVPEHPTPQAAGAQHFAMDAGEGVGEAPAAWRPAPLLEVLLQQRTAEQIVEPVPVVPLLHAFVPQMVEQLVDILALLDFRVAEQVIEVPKIVYPPRAARTVLRAPQTADQLVEVPTPVSYSSFFQRTLEQNVDNPVRGRGGRNVDLQGFLPGQGPTAPYLSLERISELIVEQIVSRWGLRVFRPGQGSSSVAHSPAAWLNLEDDPFQRFFLHFFPGRKSATATRHMGARVPRHVSSSTSSAYGPRTWVDDDTGEVWTLLTDPALGSWWYSSRTHRSQWHPPWE